MGDNPVSVDDLAAKADEHLHDGTLTPEEYEELKHSVAELSPIFAHERAYFVLGSYGRPEIHRLQLVKDRLNRRPDAYAFLMVDVRSEWTNTYLKFHLLADYTDTVVGVVEHDRGGFLVEQGYFASRERYFEKTYVLRRDYAAISGDDVETDADVDDPYSAMQTAVFEMLAETARLCTWSTEDDLVSCAESLP